MRKALVLLVCAGWLLRAQSPDDRMRGARYELKLEEGRWAGSGAGVLNEALQGAQYVLIGEDHGTAEIPAFAAAVCDAVAPLGFHTMAVESGPEAMAEVARETGRDDRVARMAELQKRYPDSVAFFNLRQENDLIAHCAQAWGGAEHFRVWGLDQEFMGAGGMLLDRLLENHPGAAAAETIRNMLKENAADEALAVAAGDPEKLFMMQATDAEMARLEAEVKREGSAEAKRLVEAFAVSRQIYLKNAQGSPDSNRQRAVLMKQTFWSDLQAAKTTEGAAPKVLFKFGDWHMYQGVNPLHQRDLGNFVAEMADGAGMKSLHIAVLGARGAHLGYAGHGRPYQPQKYELTDDSSYAFLKPLVANPVPHGWTLIDLRKLRFGNAGKVEPDLERMMEGFDLLILIPETTAAQQIQ